MRNNHVRVSALAEEEFSYQYATGQPSIGESYSIPQKFTTSEVGRTSYSSKPKGMLLTQAAQIKRLNNALNQYRNKLNKLQRENKDHQQNQNLIQQLQQNDLNKKGEIQKLSLTIKSLIASCETYRKQIGVTSTKQKQLQELNKDLINKNQYLSKTCQSLRNQNQNIRMEAEQQLKKIRQQLQEAERLLQSFKITNEDLTEKTKIIPLFEKQFFDKENQISFWQNQAEKRSQQLSTINQLYLKCQQQVKILTKQKKNYEQSYRGSNNQYTKVRNQLNQTTAALHQSENNNAFLINKINQLQNSLNSPTSGRVRQLENSLNRAQKQLQLKTKALVDFQRENNYLKSLGCSSLQATKRYYENQLSLLIKQKQDNQISYSKIVQQMKEKNKYTEFLLQKRQVENNQIYQKVKQLQEQVQKTKNKLSSSEADKTLIGHELERYKKQNKTQQFERKYTKLAEDMKKTTKELKIKIQKIQELEKTIKAQTLKNVDLQKELNQAKQQNKKKNIRINYLQDETKNLKKNIDLISTKLGNQTIANNKLRIQLAQRNSFKKNNIDNQKNKILQEQNQKLKSQISKLKKQFDEEKANLQNQNATLTSFIEQNLSTQRKIQKIIRKAQPEDFVTDSSSNNKVREITLESQKQLSTQLINSIQNMANKHIKIKQELKMLERAQLATIEENNIFEDEIKRQAQQIQLQTFEQKQQHNGKKKLEQELIRLADLLEKKTRENEKNKIKLYEFEDEIKDQFVSKFQKEVQTYESKIQQLKQQKEEILKSHEQLFKSYKDLQKIYEDVKYGSVNSFNALALKNQSDSHLLTSTVQQKQRLQYELEQTKLNIVTYELTVDKLTQELDRLQELLKSMQIQHEQENDLHKAKVIELETYRNLSNDKCKESEKQRHILTEEIQLLKERLQQFEQHIKRLEEQFLALQLLMAELRQERKQLSIKNRILAKKIEDAAQEIDLEFTRKSINEESTIRKDIQYHYDKIYSIISSAKKLKSRLKREQNQ